MENKNVITIGETTNLIVLPIATKDGKKTGEKITINLKELDLIDRLQTMWDNHKKNHSWINSQLAIIEKKQDFKKKGQIMSNNEKLQYDALRTFYKKEKENYDMFLGKGGVDKLLNGRPLEWETLIEIETIIKEQIEPKLDITMDNIVKEIKNKYKFDIKKNENVLKVDE